MQNPIVDIDFTEFPARHTCDGEDVSPRIRLSRVESPYLAVILTDPGAKGGPFHHWLIWNIPAAKEIPEGIPKKGEIESPIRGVQGKNDKGSIGYSGPCPPHGIAHEYYFNIYGLDGPLALEAGASFADLEKAMEGHTLQYSGTAVAAYRRP
jgi:Raf kinase inhibitor-like YbhB/YbcL family protein